MPKKVKIDPKKAVAAIQAIHDVLYLEPGHDTNVYNGAKEWDLDMLETIADVVAMLIPRPTNVEFCDECGNAIPVRPGGGLENKHHAESCSLYDARRDRKGGDPRDAARSG